MGYVHICPRCGGKTNCTEEPDQDELCVDCKFEEQPTIPVEEFNRITGYKKK